MPLRRLALACALLLCPALASGQSTSGLTLKDMRSFSYASMVSWAERDSRPLGVPEVAQMDGMIFLDIRAVFDVPWSDTLTRLSISSNDIVLILPDGTEVKSFGSYEYLGMMHFNPNGASASRPNGYPTDDADLYWHSLFLVPQGTQSATLRLPAKDGEPGFEGPVSVFGVTAEPDAASFARFSVTDVDLFRSLASETGDGSTRVTTRMTAPQGFVFADVEIDVAALAPNNFQANGRFYWRTYDFRLVTDQGIILPAMGERFSRKIMHWQFNGVTPGESTRRRLLWILPEGAAGATLFFGETPVAQTALPATVGDAG